MAQLKRDMEELEGVRRSLAEFFCEDASTFKIEECFKVFHQFCQKFNQAVAENERRRIQEEQVLARRKQREEQLMARKRLRKCSNPFIYVYILTADKDFLKVSRNTFSLNTARRSSCILHLNSSHLTL